jgi:hypothetical protein
MRRVYLPNSILWFILFIPYLWGYIDYLCPLQACYKPASIVDTASQVDTDFLVDTVYLIELIVHKLLLIFGFYNYGHHS